MSSNHGPQPPQPELGAVYTPGGFDDYYLPAPPAEVISPAPQRLMPEVPGQIQDGIAHLELEANEPVNRPVPTHTPVDGQMSRAYEQNGSAGYAAGNAPNIPSMTSHAPAEVPNFSPFPKVHPLPPNVPPSDEEKESILWDARVPVLNSNDPEMQLAWAQDALAYVDAAMTHEARISESQPARAATPQVEHELRLDAMNIVSFLAEQHHPKAEFMKGMWLEFGKFGQRQDKREAFRCYQRAADRGYCRAEYRMGMQFEQSNDPIKALQHYKKGADENDSASNYRLGMMTLLGQAGQPQDFARGIQLLTEAAATADENAPQGAYVLGMLQAHELNQVQVPDTFLPYDEKAARHNIEKAAYLGFAKAQLKMGSAYELCSLGCEFNPAMSLHYNALAARQGEIEGDMAISKWFLCGHEGVFQKNDQLAYTYCLRAAMAGLPTALFGMGYFYEIGLGVPVDASKAVEWYEKAAAAGNKDAEARVQSINSSGQTLSKRDHENVAVSRIKSQYGSMRGKRPAKLAGRAAAPSLPTVSDEYGDDGYENDHMQRPATTVGNIPPRTSSTTPYPMSDGPPMVSPPLERPATVAPYPATDGPPLIGGKLAGGFAAEMRPHSVGGPGPYPPNDGYGAQRGPGLPSGPAPWQNRPYSGMEGAGRGARPPNQRIASGPPASPAGYRQPGGPSLDRPEGPPGPMLPPKEPLNQGPRLDIGFSAPEDNRRRLQKPGGLQGKTMSSESYVPPLDVRKRPVGGGTPISATPMSAGPTPGGQFDRPPRMDSRPVPGRTASPSTYGTPGVGLRPGPSPSSRPPSGGRLPVSGGGPQRPTQPSAQPPAQQQPQPGKPAARPPGKGPKTFEDMGIPQQKNDQDCIVM
ncbi:HCP-like protein [Rhizodiscina lignyota]|uniref:HCP-like protein n=1 Tax=Rhizodiscina lignyota TaxID=1504668 RepID=A0A9P4I9H9_9PEZI|nr:HCP-like protein [Rhizodiscina lignyota]